MDRAAPRPHTPARPGSPPARSPAPARRSPAAAGAAPSASGRSGPAARRPGQCAGTGCRADRRARPARAACAAGWPRWRPGRRRRAAVKSAACARGTIIISNGERAGGRARRPRSAPRPAPAARRPPPPRGASPHHTQLARLDLVARAAADLLGQPVRDLRDGVQLDVQVLAARPGLAPVALHRLDAERDRPAGCASLPSSPHGVAQGAQQVDGEPRRGVGEALVVAARGRPGSPTTRWTTRPRRSTAARRCPWTSRCGGRRPRSA